MYFVCCWGPTQLSQNLPAQDDLAGRDLLVQLVHVFGELHINRHLQSRTQPSQPAAGMWRALGRHRPAPPPHRTSSSDSLCGTEKQLVTSTECLSTVPAGRAARLTGTEGIRGGPPALPPPALTQQRADDPRRALVAPLEAVHDGGEHHRVQPHHAAAGEGARERGGQRRGRLRCQCRRGGGGGGRCRCRGCRWRGGSWGCSRRRRSHRGSRSRHFAKERG